MAAVILKNLEKVYPGNVRAVKGIDLQIENGEFMILVGPSGCAKSTTLRMIAGLESITSGEVEIGDVVVNDVHPKDRRVAMVFQNYALYPHMTVYENMSFGLKIRKKSPQEIAERIKLAAERLEITELLQRKPKELSGGQKQRVAVGRAIVAKPEVFLFDEPLSNLDAKLRLSMRVRIAKLHQELRDEGRPATMVYVTHDQVEAMTMGDRVCVMSAGDIQQVDTPTNVYNSPVNKFVAGFIGTPSMNFFDGKLIKEDSKHYLQLKEIKIEVPEKQALRLKDQIGNALWLGIRPEYIKLDDCSATINKFQAEVSFIERLGAEDYIHIIVDGLNCVCKLAAEDTVKNGIKEGQVLSFFLDLCKSHFFDFKTEQNLTL